MTGAAIGTTVGRTVGVAYQVWSLRSGRGRLRLEGRHLRLDRGLMLQLVRLSVGGIGQFLIGTASWLGLVRILTVFGASALAGYTIALRVIVVALLPAWGMSNAVATLVGQNLGAGKPDRAERSVWIVGLYNMAFLLGVMGVVPLGRGAAHRAVQPGRRGAAARRAVPARRELRVRLLRLGHGPRAGVQRGRATR